MMSMLSQMSASKSRITPFQYAAPCAPKTGVWTKAAMIGTAIFFALVVVNGVSGIAQAFGIA